MGCSRVVQEASVFAIIQSGGRQVKVTPGAVITVDHVLLEPGEQVSIDRVLLVGTDDGGVVTGAPFVTNARVVGVIAGETRGPKIRVFKKKRRKTSRQTIGHRTTFTKVEVREITL
jgi:large subunit ribosomal protein L21